MSVHSVSSERCNFGNFTEAARAHLLSPFVFTTSIGRIGRNCTSKVKVVAGHAMKCSRVWTMVENVGRLSGCSCHMSSMCLYLMKKNIKLLLREAYCVYLISGASIIM